MGHSRLTSIPAIPGLSLKSSGLNNAKLSRPAQDDKPGYVGVEGDRLYFFLKFVVARSTKRGYTVYSFVDEIGSSFICFSDDLRDENNLALIVDACYLVKATVKRHQENTFLGVLKINANEETVLNRIIIVHSLGQKENK